MKTIQNKELFNRLKSIFPPLKSKSHKGEGGRIGIIGGSYEFSGAPYYSAMSSLKTGSDLTHIFCAKASSSAIKSYSPEVIVHPVFESTQQFKCKEQQIQSMLQDWIQKIFKWEKAVYTWVIGPGLGRDKYMHSFFPKLIRRIPQKSVVVIDADGIYYLCQHKQLFQELGKFKTIITPNKKQLEMIQKTLSIKISSQIQKILETSKEGQIQQFETSLKFPNFSMLIKGQSDILIGQKNIIISVQGGRKRCAGIGDIVAGTIAACSFWDFTYGPALASLIVRQSTKQAFKKQGRGLTAPNVLYEIPSTVQIIEDFHIQ